MYLPANENYFDVLGAARKTYSRLLEPICHQWNLTRNELDVMLFLLNNPAYDRAVDIVSCRGISKSHVSLSVANLEARGFLKRHFDENDRRTTHLKLLEPGAKIASQAKEVQHRFFSALFQGITQEELEIWDGILQKISQNAENLDKL